MIGHSSPEYIFIRISIFLLRSVAPLSIAELAGSLYAGEWLFSRWLGCYAVAETAFYALVYLPRTWYMQKVSIVLRRSPLRCLVLFSRARLNEAGLGQNRG